MQQGRKFSNTLGLCFCSIIKCSLKVDRLDSENRVWSKSVITQLITGLLQLWQPLIYLNGMLAGGMKIWVSNYPSVLFCWLYITSRDYTTRPRGPWRTWGAAWKNFADFICVSFLVSTKSHISIGHMDRTWHTRLGVFGLWGWWGTLKGDQKSGSRRCGKIGFFDGWYPPNWGRVYFWVVGIWYGSCFACGPHLRCGTSIYKGVFW